MVSVVKRCLTRFAAIASLGALVATGSLAGAQVPAAHAASSTTQEEAIIAASTNALRAATGRAAFKRNSAMDTVARNWAKQLATSGKFYHNPNYANQIPAGWHTAGENIAMGYYGGKQLYTLWKNSPGHYANMINTGFNTIGIGVYKTASGAYYGVQVFGGYTSQPAGTYAIVAPKVSASTVSVTGTKKVGMTVKAATSASNWGPDGTALKYQWYLNNAAVRGATGTSYKIPASAAGKRISVRVTGTHPDAQTASASSPQYTVAKASLTAKAVRISGTAKVGKKLTAKTATWGPGAVKLRYQWYSNGKKVKGATKVKFSVAKKYKGKKITVKVTGSKSGYVNATKTAKTVRIK